MQTPERRKENAFSNQPQYQVNSPELMAATPRLFHRTAGEIKQHLAAQSSKKTHVLFHLQTKEREAYPRTPAAGLILAFLIIRAKTKIWTENIKKASVLICNDDFFFSLPEPLEEVKSRGQEDDSAVVRACCCSPQGLSSVPSPGMQLPTPDCL